MAKERLSMRKIREILRLKYDCGLTDRQIAKSCSGGQWDAHENMRFITC
jgi:hypothetical protein